MGIEVWVVVTLITALFMYLLPLLVGRHEMARRSNAQNRYLVELWVLATGAAAAERDDTYANSGYAETFRHRLEVRVMNRPTVRNVRALRTEHEFDRARQIHAQRRERHRVATSHRGVIASVLLGASFDAWALDLAIVLPWWPALLLSTLPGASVVAGRRTALTPAAVGRRECRRITELEQTLATLADRRSSASVMVAPRSVVDGPRNVSSGVASAVNANAALPAVSVMPVKLVEAVGDSGMQDSFIERLAHESTQQSAACSVSAKSAMSAETAVGIPAEVAGTAVIRPSRTVGPEEERLARLDADLDDETAVTVVTEREAARRASVRVPPCHAGRVTRDISMREVVSRNGDEENSPCTKDLVAFLPTLTSRGRPGWGELFAEASAIEQKAQECTAAVPFPQVAVKSVRRTATASTQLTPRTASRITSEPVRPVVRSQALAIAAPVEAEGVVKEEATTSTPPQDQ